MTYTVYRINLNGLLSHKEYLNDKVEVADWMNDAIGKHANVRIENDKTGEIRQFTDYAGTWDRIA
jgi:hypothetical protein